MQHFPNEYDENYPCFPIPSSCFAVRELSNPLLNITRKTQASYTDLALSLFYLLFLSLPCQISQLIYSLPFQVLLPSKKEQNSLKCYKFWLLLLAYNIQITWHL